MLCEIGEYGFFALWGSFTVLGLISMLILSGAVFIPYYVRPTFEMWQFKSNPKFPSPLLVKREIIHMCKGLVIATFCPALTITLSNMNFSNGYCGTIPPELAASKYYLSIPMQAALIFFFTDVYEYIYHYMGHTITSLWSVHKHHHHFYNPSPFAVIADEYLDQFVRTWPMIILPMVTPINVDLLFVIFATLFYGFGVYLHWGYESPKLSAHNPIFNTAYHHYMHHAISVKNKAIFTGFFFKLWDQICGTNDPGPCRCFECRPKRSLEEWQAVTKPDYSVLLDVKWWFTTDSYKIDK